MNAGVAIALRVEARKAVASTVFRTATVLAAAGVSVLAGALVAAALLGNQAVIAQLGAFGDESGWPLLTAVVAQITAAGGLLAFGVALSWSFGREFADGTITGLFALPVPRSAIALAKLLVHGTWALLVAATLTALVAAAGLALALEPGDADVLGSLGRQFTLTVCTALIAVPAAWASTLGRGMLPGIATTIGLVVVTQLAIVAGAAAWFPLAAPALWALAPDAVSWPQLALAALVPLGFGALTLASWTRLQLDR